MALHGIKDLFISENPSLWSPNRMSHFLGSSSCSRTKLLENSLVEYIPQIISYLARHLCQAFSSSSGILYLPVMIEYPGHRQLGLRKTRGESYNSTVDSDWPGLENHINPWNIFPIHNPRENPMVFGRKAGCLKEDSDDVCLQNSTDPYQRKIWAEPDPSTEQAEASPGTKWFLSSHFHTTDSSWCDE